MTQEPEHRMRGLARVAFIANLVAIRTELAEGWTAKSIYDRHADKLAGRISYPQFVRYVRQLRETEPALPVGRVSPPAPPVTRPAPPPVLPREPTRPRTFVYDGNPRADDEERLIGKPALHRDGAEHGQRQRR